MDNDPKWRLRAQIVPVRLHVRSELLFQVGYDIWASGTLGTGSGLLAITVSSA